jgi:general L-amino acid transport system permease protein
MLAILRDGNKRAILNQIIFIVVAGLIVYYLGNNLVENLNRLGISTGFGFLWEQSGYNIGGSLIPYNDYDSYGMAHVVGLLNTLLSTALIIASASILGFVLGVMRMSPNPSLSNTIRYAIELIRNIPSLVHIVIWFTLTLRLPKVRQSYNINDTVFINNRGINIPSPTFEPLMWLVTLVFFSLVIFAFIRRKRADKHMEITGEFRPTFLSNTIMIWGITGALYFFLGGPIIWDYPTLKGFNFKGGIAMVPELFAIWIALSIYFSTHVAELVRGGVQAVSSGQFEAADALGVKRWITMRLIVIPQALRVIIPPLTNVYQNILKTTSLGVAIGFTEMTATTGGTTLNLTGQAVECVLILMVSYGTISLLIAWVMNIINKQVAIVEW